MTAADIRKILRTGLIFLCFAAGPVYGNDVNISAGSTGEPETHRSAVELERAILNDNDWMADADRLMAELKTLDVRLYTLINTTGGEDSRQKLIRERNNIRRLIVDLLEARNTVYARLQENRLEYTRLELSPEMNFPVGF